MNLPAFLDLPPVEAHEADILLLPLPYEATVSYGGGTARAPEAIWRASTEVELWDEQLVFDLETLRWHTAPAVVPGGGESGVAEPSADYLARVEQAARDLHRHEGLVVGVGGEHGLTPPLVRAARGGDDLSGVTVVQFDAHADLRESYAGSPHSHASAMRRLVEANARLVAVGIRSADRDEAAFAQTSDRVTTFPARLLGATNFRLPGEENLETALLDALRRLEGDVYLTIDMDVFEVHLCPATGTPQPGGLGWWQTLRYLHALLVENNRCRLIGLDLVEAVPQPGTQVNEFTAALLLAKLAIFSRYGEASWPL